MAGLFSTGIGYSSIGSRSVLLYFYWGRQITMKGVLLAGKTGQSLLNIICKTCKTW